MEIECKYTQKFCMNPVANVAMVGYFEIVSRKFKVVRIFGTAEGSNVGKMDIKSIINL
jgi:hypothetical protein